MNKANVFFFCEDFSMSYVEVGSFVNKACGVSGVGLFYDLLIVLEWQ